MRPEIQGLRAVAVLLVVLFHLWPDAIPGGYVGVDVFFVISGFLITAHLLREVDRTGSVSLSQFWARRVRRLLPAAYLVLAASAVAVLVLVPRLLWRQFFGEILSAALYVENWTLAFNSVDYLAADNTPSPAQHYWTLSAEEQFYLVWPLLVLLGVWLATRRASTGRRRGGVLAVLTVGTLASLGYSLWITATNPAWAYFATPARAWEFGAGALLAFAPAVARRIPPVARALLGWAALVTLLACAVVLDAKTPMPGTAAIWVVVASALLIWVEAPPVGWASSQLLVTTPARFLGDISYSTYLWHWPLIILLPYATDHALTTIDRFSILLATIGASFLTKRYVEDPVRRARHFGLARPRTTFVYAAAGAVVLTALCVVPRVEVTRDVERTQQMTAELTAHPPRCFGAESRDPQKDCPNPSLETVMVPGVEGAGRDRLLHPQCSAPLNADPLRPCVFGTPKAGVPRIAVIGDSHARLLMSMLADQIDAGKLVVDMFVLSACPWSTGGPNRGAGPARADCAAMQHQLFPLLDRTAGKYAAILTTSRVNELRGTPREQVAGLTGAWGRVARQGVPVFAVRDNPSSDDPRRNPNFCLAEVDASSANRECSIDRAEGLERWFDAYRVAAKRTSGATEIDLSRFYCDEDTCPVVVGGVNVYADNNHLTVTYARTLGPYLLAAMAEKGVDLR